jgi:hypothetical protein
MVQRERFTGFSFGNGSVQDSLRYFLDEWCPELPTDRQENFRDWSLAFVLEAQLGMDRREWAIWPPGSNEWADLMLTHHNDFLSSVASLVRHASRHPDEPVEMPPPKDGSGGC